MMTPTTPVPEVMRIRAAPPQRLPDGWWNWRNVLEAQARLADAALAGLMEFSLRAAGKGIVICGGGRYFASTYVTLRVLRQVGCSLPVEVWHLTGEMEEHQQRLLAELGASCVDADVCARSQPYRFLHGHWWKGWQLKPFAVLHSRFREVLLLDADCYPARNPEFLFSSDTYERHGSLFWTSCAEPHPGLAPEQWAAFDLPPQPDSAFESGQFVVNKATCWRELNLSVHYNAQADFTYRHVLGDKDTFLIAWRRLGRAYGQLWPVCGQEGPAALQFDDRGEVLFVHRALSKFTLGQDGFDSSRQRFGENAYVPALPHEDFAHAALEELKTAFFSFG